MTQRGPFLFSVALLFVAGAGIAGFRHIDLGIPLLPGAQQLVWQVEAQVEFAADGTVQAYLTLPPEQSGLQIVSNSYPSSGYGLTVETSGRQPRAHWTKRTALGDQVLFYKLDLVQDPGYEVADEAPARVVPVPFDEPYRTAASQVLTSLLPITADALTLAQQIILEINTVPLDQNMNLLLDRYRAPQLVARLLTIAGIPARTVKVLPLEDGRRRQLLTDFLQVWHEGRWLLFNPNTGLVANTDNLLLWQTDAPSVLEVIGGTRSRVTFSMISQTRSTMGLATQQEDPFNLSLYSLPIAEQGMFKLIMLLPVGALVVVIMRLLIGVRTSGTFMPILIALTFLQTELVPGIISLILVVSVGLMLRSYLSALNLLLVARIATIVVIVIGIVSFFAVISYRLGLIGGQTITFFPMIILAWTIERMSILWEEEGPREVLIQGGGSLLVSVLAYLLMSQATVAHLAFNFPELHLCLLATIMLIGRYTGYRLLELHRFAALGNHARG